MTARGDGLDVEPPRLVAEWLGERRWWSSGPLPLRRRVAVVSSRMPRLLHPQDAWLRGMRAALIRLRDPQVVAIVGAQTATHRMLARGTERQGTPHILVTCCDVRERSEAAWQRVWNQTPLPHQSLRTDLWGLPPAAPEETTNDVDAAVRAAPERDRATLAWAQEIIVLAVRSRGNLHSLLRERLKRRDVTVLLADLPGSHARDAQAELQDLGAALWSVPHEGTLDQTAIASTPIVGPARENARIVPCPPAGGWAFLSHATRACPGPWPEQTEQEYQDSLLDGDSDADHSPLRALMRIARRRRLVASSQGIRGGFRVVSFTAAPLAELPSLRVFRAHRGRWDFEPYGICIRREWLERRGARPVTYGGESEWSELAAEHRPWFQHVRLLDAPHEKAAGPSRAIDWSSEREWRHVGDVELDSLPPDTALLFVPSVADARKLLEIGPWPVTVLGDELERTIGRSSGE